MSQSSRRSTTAGPSTAASRVGGQGQGRRDGGDATTTATSARSRQIVQDSDDEGDNDNDGDGDITMAKTKGKGKGKGRETETEAERETDEWAELLGPFTKPQVAPEYRNQPIPREAANTRLGMLARDWVAIDKKITDSMTALMNAATDLQEALSGMDETGGIESEVRLCRTTCWDSLSLSHHP